MPHRGRLCSILRLLVKQQQQQPVSDGSRIHLAPYIPIVYRFSSLFTFVCEHHSHSSLHLLLIASLSSFFYHSYPPPLQYPLLSRLPHPPLITTPASTFLGQQLPQQPSTSSDNTTLITSTSPCPYHPLWTSSPFPLSWIHNPSPPSWIISPHLPL